MLTDSMSADSEVTQLLQAWGEGDADALGQLIPMVFDDLHRMARYYFQRESPGHSLQPTALISELYLRLQGEENTHWESRQGFFYFAGKLMRHILVDHARQKKARKRGGDLERVPLDHSLEVFTELDVDVIDLDQALDELAGIDPRQARIVELRFFVGLSVQETAEVMGIAGITVKREWRTAKFWLNRRLGSPQPDEPPEES